MNSNLADPAVLRELLTRYGFHFSKAMGQNFLVNPGVCPRMAEACGGGDPDCAGVLEIGPGVGVLTVELSKTAEQVAAVELDRRLLPLLEETLSGCENVRVVQGDVLEMDLEALIKEQFPGRGERKIAVCANLPYYITSPVIMTLLESGLALKALTLMVQKEAAQRICAAPGERACGAVSVAVRYRAEPHILFTVGRGSFLPPPRVDSAVIRLDLLERPPVEVGEEGAFFELVRAGFAQRRKTAANSIAAGGRYTKPAVEAALGSLGLSPALRAEALTLEQWGALSQILQGGAA